MLKTENEKLARLYPGDAIGRQPVHTFIAGGDTFTRESALRAGKEAISTFKTFAPTAQAFAKIVGMSGDIAEKVCARVLNKLEREPIEDFRIDFEDGYGTRPDAEEDGHAKAAALEVAAAMKDGTLPPFIGIRIKPMSRELNARSLRTLDIS